MASSVDRMVLNIIGDPGSGSAPGNGSGQGWGGKGVEKTLGQQLKKIAGIDLGIGALLKQSQIFTGYLGNIFALVGALIDTILAPLAPIAFKALADLGKKLPQIAAMAEKHIPKVVAFLGSVVRGIDSIGKFIHQDWAKWMGLALAALVGIRIAVSTATMTGRMAGSAVGLRGGYLSQGIGMMRGGGAATTATSAATGAAATGGRAAGIMGKLGGARVIGGVGGGIFGGLTGYAGGRSQGMSQGMSAGRGIASGIGGAAGAALLSPLGPAGMAIGGMAGSTLTNVVFDKLFGDKSGAAGGRTDETGQIGLAGYSAPMVVASASQKYADQVEESGQIIANAVLGNASAMDEAKAVNKQYAAELVKIAADEAEEIKKYKQEALKALTIERQIIATAGKVGDLSFARGAGAGEIRSSKTALEFQGAQIANELKTGIKKGGYSLASSLGFGSEAVVTQQGGKITLSEQAGEGEAARNLDLNITFGGHDGSQQILRYEKAGKVHQIKMEEDYSGSGW